MSGTYVLWFQLCILLLIIFKPFLYPGFLLTHSLRCFDQFILANPGHNGSLFWWHGIFMSKIIPSSESLTKCQMSPWALPFTSPELQKEYSIYNFNMDKIYIFYFVGIRLWGNFQSQCTSYSIHEWCRWWRRSCKS